jgi:virginiamycin B lyase
MQDHDRTLRFANVIALASSVPDKNGNVWAGSIFTDRISRIDSATGRVIDYQLPSTTNTRRVWVDNSTNPVALRTGANHEAAIVKLEVLP